MKKMKIIGALMMTLAMFHILPLEVGASTEKSITFSTGENNAVLTDALDVHVNNGEEKATIVIEQNGSSVFENSVDAIHIQSIDLLTESGSHYAIIAYRYDCSSNALYFDVLQFWNSHTEM